MLEIRPTCEHCNNTLPFDSKEAMICTFECTFCADCTENHFDHVCPNCGGELVRRPVRPAEMLKGSPASTKRFVKDHDVGAFKNHMSEGVS